MKRIQLQLAKLRKARNMTQQELSDIVGTSCQNISKWENGTTTPDITVLPVLADFFQVSVDELLGLVPLKGERYLPEGTDTEDFGINIWSICYGREKQDGIRIICSF